MMIILMIMMMISWAASYRQLEEENGPALAVVRGALLVVCLDEAAQNPTDPARSAKDRA